MKKYSYTFKGSKLIVTGREQQILISIVLLFFSWICYYGIFYVDLEMSSRVLLFVLGLSLLWFSYTFFVAGRRLIVDPDRKLIVFKKYGVIGLSRHQCNFDEIICVKVVTDSFWNGSRRGYSTFGHICILEVKSLQSLSSKELRFYSGYTKGESIALCEQVAALIECELVDEAEDV